MFLDDIKILIIYNPKAGKGKIKRIMPEVKRMFTKAGLTPLFHGTTGRNDAKRIAGRFVTQYYKDRMADQRISPREEGLKDREHNLYVIAAGGDGTLNEVLRGVLETGCDVPIGIIPAGSTNDFGYSLGINDGMIKAAEKALDAILMDEAFQCDVLKFNDQYVTYTAAFGLFSDVSYATPQKLKNTFGHAAYIMYGAKNIFKTHPVQAKIEYSCGGEGSLSIGKDTDTEDLICSKEVRKLNEKLLLGMIVSAKSVGGFRGITGESVELDDGEDELMFVRWPKNPLMLVKTVWHAIGMIRKSRKAQEQAGDLSIEYGIKIIKVKDARFMFDKPVSWALDGENGGEQTNVQVNVIKQAVSYLIL